MQLYDASIMKKALLKAVEIAGGQLALANRLDAKVKQAHVWGWINKTRDGVPAEHVISVAEATGWAVTPHELRPDLYPHPHDGLPVHLRVAA